ncbi:MAG TPA: extracellular solute-binding protein [Sphaerochaeta sp.]|mgnify:CR=1 FL=1|jgi:spermidine/putrescine transport system substrate-binding protein|nr:extracellular solute-binding protein [Sphaerochaeta sp.]HPZ15579.1 extracellular solute-binding protein [Sphaerochaeta sp.]
MSKPTHKILITTLMVIVFTALLVTACSKEGSGKGGAKQKLYVYNWSYYTPDEVIESFEKEFGVDVVLDYFASNEEMYAKLKASKNSGYDLVFPSGDYVSIMMAQGMLERIDTSKMDNLVYITDFAREKSTYDPNMEYSVPYYLGASGIAVHTKMVKNYERSWNIFADTRYTDRMVMMDDMREVLGDALAYLGYSVNTKDAAQLKEAQQLVDKKWKPNLVKFDAEGFAKAFASGEYWISHGYAEAIFEEINEKEWGEVDFFLPEGGGPMYIDAMCIPKGARNYELALAFINYIHKPENYAKLLDRFHFPASVNTEADTYRTTVPFYTIEQLKEYELKEDLGSSLVMYNSAWEKIRYVN